ncbi:unnamed protein product [Rotaria socialis]|nr:unnamed protein product [Rotaria socialis]
MTLDQHDRRRTFHVDMNTKPAGESWTILVGPQQTALPVSAIPLSGDSRVQINGGPTGTYTLYIQWFGSPTLNDHYNDDFVAALCRTQVNWFLN